MCYKCHEFHSKFPSLALQAYIVLLHLFISVHNSDSHISTRVSGIAKGGPGWAHSHPNFPGTVAPTC